MHVTVKGKNLDVPPHVRDEAVAKLSKVRKLFDRFIDMEVVFSEDRNPRIASPIHCEVVIHAKGKTVRAEASASDPLSAIDAVQDKLRHQVRTLKGKRLARLQGRFAFARRDGHPRRGDPSRGDGAEASTAEVDATD